MTPWEFWIDVGGTFTDCIARCPEGRLVTAKVLSSGRTKGRVDRLEKDKSFVDPSHRGDAPDFWNGYEIRILDESGNVAFQSRVATFDASCATFTLESPLPSSLRAGQAFELSSNEEAPIVAIRTILGLPLAKAIPPVVVKLGTTRGTNALLTRRGARTAFVTTKGFADVLRIANQDRPRLFDLAIQKPTPLFEQVVEIDERVDAQGQVLIAPNAARVREQFTALKATGVESVAICLLHSFANPVHEELVENAAREAGFTEISTSSRLSPLIKIVSRGDTTVMDAYLNPILRDYVRKLRASLHGSTLKLMTSSGGLVDADRFVGKDSVLSGPAGGVIGFSRTARLAGFSKSIGFDMGGTSTDVSRFDGRYEMEFETQKAGVRVVAPMLSIETVAAGGGSICEFDGVQLRVGPQSAGSDPGPACYGRGGPLTVTDLNLYLGKILPTRFPFALDRSAVERRLVDLCERIAVSPMGRRYTPLELAEGFLQIANANMVRAIRKVSVAKGYDPADYVLVTFGGAGGQHACAMAKALGIGRVLSHPYAGLLSAYGIGQADVRRFGVRSVLKPLADETLKNLDEVFNDLAAEARTQVANDGVPDRQIQPPVRSLEMRYKGVDAAILVDAGESNTSAAELATRYNAQHQQLYGYTHASRPIEIVAARVEVVGVMPEPDEHPAEPRNRRPEPAETTRAWFEGTDHATGVFLRSQLHAGDVIVGPAIVCEPTSTLLVDPGCTATVGSRGELVVDVGASKSPESEQKQSKAPTSADPVLLEIFNNLFASIAEQMGLTLQRTSVSTNVKERLDFSCAIFSPKGDLVVNAPHIPVHLGAMSETVKRIIADNPQMRPGDVFVTNDPYRGGSHLPDVTVITPVHEPTTAELLFFTASRAHHAEIGGIVPGSMPPFSKNLGEEGVLIRNFKLVDAGASREDDLKAMLLSGRHPTRNVNDNLSDVSAQVAANASGVRQLQELVDRYTLPVVQAYMRFIQQAAAEKMRRALARLPDRAYRYTDHLDNGSSIAVTITKSGESATVDFAGTGEVLSSNLNANRAIVTAACLYVFRCLINEDIPLNSGVLEPVKIVLPECLLNPPEHPNPAECAAMVGGNVETSQRVVDTLLGALGLAAASQGTMNNLTFGDATFGYYETICGGSGATPESAGADAVHTHMTNTRLTDVEVIERRYPVRIRKFAIRERSGGGGHHRGGDGIVRQIEFLKPLRVSMLSERRGDYLPFGLQGGSAGHPGRNTLNHAPPPHDSFGACEGMCPPCTEGVDLGGKFSTDVQAGDILTIETPGGGGVGRSDAAHQK
jgi:5-oxoprolinase (ATP-hydrolysing)